MHFVRLTFTSTHPISAGLVIPPVGTVFDAGNDDRTYTEVHLVEVELVTAPASATMANTQSNVRLTYLVDVETDDSTPAVGTPFDMRNDTDDFHGVLSKVSILAEEEVETPGVIVPLAAPIASVIFMKRGYNTYEVYGSVESVVAKLVSLGLGASAAASMVDEALTGSTRSAFWHSMDITIIPREVL